MMSIINIAHLTLRLATSRKVFNPAIGGFPHFIVPEEHFPSQDAMGAPSEVLTLVEAEEALPAAQGSLLEGNDTWDLWQDRRAGYLFHFKHYQQVCVSVQVDPAFSTGRIEVHEGCKGRPEMTLLDIIDIRLYLNWLANFGDIILHASGLVYEGRGYCFLGESHRGKSTLVRHLAGRAGVTVLGEDQVILRYLDGQFRLFGTPWHSDSRLCAALDAPLEKMFFLDRGRASTLSLMNPLEAATRTLQTAFVPYYRKDCMPLILERVGLLAERTRCLWLAYNLEQDGLETLLTA